MLVAIPHCSSVCVLLPFPIQWAVGFLYLFYKSHHRNTINDGPSFRFPPKVNVPQRWSLHSPTTVRRCSVVASLYKYLHSSEKKVMHSVFVCRILHQLQPFRTELYLVFSEIWEIGLCLIYVCAFAVFVHIQVVWPSSPMFPVSKQHRTGGRTRPPKDTSAAELASILTLSQALMTQTPWNWR